MESPSEPHKQAVPAQKRPVLRPARQAGGLNGHHPPECVNTCAFRPSGERARLTSALVSFSFPSSHCPSRAVPAGLWRGAVPGLAQTPTAAGARANSRICSGLLGSLWYWKLQFSLKKKKKKAMIAKDEVRQKQGCFPSSSLPSCLNPCPLQAPLRRASGPLHR